MVVVLVVAAAVVVVVVCWPFKQFLYEVLPGIVVVVVVRISWWKHWTCATC